MIQGLLAIVVVLGLLALPLALVISTQGDLRRLRERVARLEAEIDARGGGAEPPLPPRDGPAERAAATAPLPAASVAEAPPAGTAVPAPLPAASVTPTPPAAPALAPALAGGAADAPAADDARGIGGIEQVIGGVWMQNLGAVVLLIGVFLMIVWGYTNHRIGPGAVVMAGAALGIAFAWRGELVSRRVPAFGHALIGTGLGIVYLTLYLGFVQLHVLGVATALALLALVSFVAIAAGLRHRVQLIAALGVIGAFLPQFMTAWLGLGGFHMTPWQLLGYTAVVDLLVFGLTARAGWSRLDLAALVLGALAWITAFHGIDWGWGAQLALAGLYTLLGLAPLPRLVRTEGALRPADMAVISLAPLALLGASAPFLAWAASDRVAILLFALAAVHLAAAAWVDRRRPERDAWVPLTGAAALFFTAGLDRALSPQVTPLAWCAEGVLLLVLGLRPRAGSLRVWGHLVLLAGALRAFGDLFAGGWQPGMPPVVYAGSLRRLAATAALLVAAAVLARGRARLKPLERFAPEAWGALGNLMLLAWSGIEASHAAATLLDPAPGVHRMPPPVGTDIAVRREALAGALRAFAWAAQAAVLAWRGSAGDRRFQRICGYAVGVFALASFVLWGAPCQGGYDAPAFVHPTALLHLGVVALAFAIAARFASRTAAGVSVLEARVVAVVASGALMLWNAREAWHLARTLAGGAAAGAVGSLGRMESLSATVTSGAWLLEALALFVAGWLRGSAFLRWCGLALVAVTLLKFALYDLRTVDVFWRFLTAIGVGAAMLALSYAYQRRLRGGARQG